MEAVLRNLAGWVQLLAVAERSGEVEQWDRHTVSAAFRWARYCESLCSGFDGDAAASRAAEGQLQLTAQSVAAALPGCAGVSLADLSVCRHQLLVGLLNNPKLPSSILRSLFDGGGPADAQRGLPRDAPGLCDHVVCCRSACQVLKPLTDSAVGAGAEVQGQMLMERLGVLRSHGGGASRTEQFLDSVLQGCEAGHVCLVIAAALLTEEDSATESASREFLMGWLQKKHDTLELMCSALPTAVLTELAKAHLKFRGAYCGVLKKWASDMEYNLSEGEWVPTGANPTVSFQKLTEHFQALFETLPSLRDSVQAELKALKISDGDFDVRGLSVWGDLLSALNQ